MQPERPLCGHWSVAGDPLGRMSLHGAGLSAGLASGVTGRDTQGSPDLPKLGGMSFPGLHSTLFKAWPRWSAHQGQAVLNKLVYRN